MPPHWSFSRWQTYELCPYQARLKYIDEIRLDVKGDTAASDRGTEIHEWAQALLDAKKLGEVPPVLEVFHKDIKWLRSLGALAEVELGLTRDWEYCAFDAENYWWHGALDVVVWLDESHVLIVDWKTGKIRDAHKTQLELYALVVLCVDKRVQKVSVEDWYIDQSEKNRKSRRITYTRNQLPMLKKLWERRITPMFSDRAFVPCPNFLCGWCDYRVELGSGLCQYGSK